jgi:hypothetical protein
MSQSYQEVGQAFKSLAQSVTAEKSSVGASYMIPQGEQGKETMERLSQATTVGEVLREGVTGNHTEADSLYAQATSGLQGINSGRISQAELPKYTTQLRQALELDMQNGYVSNRWAVWDVNPWYSFTWQSEPEKEKQFLDACVAASAQKAVQGKDPRLTENEIFSIKNLYRIATT